MQASLHDKKTITSARRGVISHPEARKNVLWYLDSFSAAVAAARAHLNKVEENVDALYTTADQAEVRARIGTRLDNEFEALKRVIEQYFYCQERHIPRPHLVPVSPIDHDLTTQDTGKLQRQVMRETLGQLESCLIRHSIRYGGDYEPVSLRIRLATPHTDNHAPTTFTKGSDMEYTIADVATCIQEMREAFLEEGTVTSEDDTVTTRAEAKKKVLWHLDEVAGDVARARQHISNFQADDIFSPADKDRMEEEIIAGLRKKLMLEEVIKDYSYCLHRHFQHLVDDNYPVTFGDEPREIQLEKRQVIHEVLRQVEFIDRELEDFRCGAWQARHDVIG
jgi:hypothetical protein